MLGNGDLKSKNEKGSDGGEYNSHTSAARPIASEVMSVEEVFSDVKIEQALSGKEDCLAMVERDLKSKDCYEGENGRFEHIETAKESCLESKNHSGISNDESLAEKNSKDDEFVKSDDSLPSNVAAVKINLPDECEDTDGKSAAEDSINSGNTTASVSAVEKGNTQSVFLENSVAPLQEVIDLSGKMNEDSVYPSTNENAKTSSFEEPKFTNVVVHTKNSETPKSSKNQVWHLLLYTCFIT
jgi:hypothetical protein